MSTAFMTALGLKPVQLDGSLPVSSPLGITTVLSIKSGMQVVSGYN